MKFGELVLSEYGLIENYECIDSEFINITTIKIGKYIFTRPDNGRVIIEVESYLTEQNPNTVYSLNKANIEYFKELIRNRYDGYKTREREEINTLLMELEKGQGKAKELQYDIEVNEKKNEEEFSESRAKNIRGLSKALRKHQGKMRGIKGKISKRETYLQKYEKEKAYSLQYVEETLKKFGL